MSSYAHPMTLRSFSDTTSNGPLAEFHASFSQCDLWKSNEKRLKQSRMAYIGHFYRPNHHSFPWSSMTDFGCWRTASSRFMVSKLSKFVETTKAMIFKSLLVPLGTEVTRWVVSSWPAMSASALIQYDFDLRRTSVKCLCALTYPRRDRSENPTRRSWRLCDQYPVIPWWQSCTRCHFIKRRQETHFEIWRLKSRDYGEPIYHHFQISRENFDRSWRQAPGSVWCSVEMDDAFCLQ